MVNFLDGRQIKKELLSARFHGMLVGGNDPRPESLPHDCTLFAHPLSIGRADVRYLEWVKGVANAQCETLRGISHCTVH